MQSWGTDDAMAGNATARLTSTAATTLTRPGPSRALSAPVTCMQARAPRDMKRTATPRALCEAPTWALTSGIRAAQVPKTKPSIANKMATATRSRCSGAGRTGEDADDERRPEDVRTRSRTGKVTRDHLSGREGRVSTHTGGGGAA